MKNVAIRIRKNLRTVRRQIKRSIEDGEVKMIRQGLYQKVKYHGLKGLSLNILVRFNPFFL